MAEPLAVKPCRLATFGSEACGDALRQAADWIDDHYAEGNPLAVTLEWVQDDQIVPNGRWFVMVFQDV